MTDALRTFVRGEKDRLVNTPAHEQARSDQIRNHGGGWGFEVSEQDRLERFAILGTDKGTYYVKERDLTKENVSFLRDAVKRDVRNVVDTAVDVSVNGRAYKNDPALFMNTLALVEGNDKRYAGEALQRTARTFNHMYTVSEYIDNLGGWGVSKRLAVARWLEAKSANTLAFQAVKYRQRDGWRAADLLRLSHPENLDENVVNFILGNEFVHEGILGAFAQAQAAANVKELLAVLDANPSLPWEALPTWAHREPEVWKKLFYNDALRGQALVRSITRLARLKAFDDLQFAADYAVRLTDAEMIKSSRLHPVNYLNAAVVHEKGAFDRDEKSGYVWGATRRVKNWETSGIILDALNAGFHEAFASVEPAGKRTLVAVDVSSSMAQAALGLELSCAQVSGVVASTIARKEPASMIRGFADNFRDLRISGGTSIGDAIKNVTNQNFGSTNVSLPMKWALTNKIEIDTFVVITDNETNRGGHPYQALKAYRDKTGIPARLAVLGVAGTGVTVADPKDKGQMDFVGFDSSAPRALADFSAGRL